MPALDVALNEAEVENHSLRADSIRLRSENAELSRRLLIAEGKIAKAEDRLSELSFRVRRAKAALGVPALDVPN